MVQYEPTKKGEFLMLVHFGLVTLEIILLFLGHTVYSLGKKKKLDFYNFSSGEDRTHDLPILGKDG